MSAETQEFVQECVEHIKQAKSIAALTGAGVSTSAGIPDFRGPQGLYVTRRYNPETVFDIEYFNQNPKPFFEFARDFAGLIQKIKPTLTHRFLARLEQEGNLRGIITQNIDCLHQAAGSSNVFEMHGSIGSSFCLQCNKDYSFDEMKEKMQNEVVPKCECSGVIKPDIVFFGENVKHLFQAADLAGQVDLLFVIGTSCVVYPAAMIPDYAMGKIIIVNKGDVQLSLGNIVLRVDADLDNFFNEVSECLNLSLDI